MTTHSERKTPGSFTEPIESGEPAEQAAYTWLIRTAARLEGELNRLLRSAELTGATYNILRILEAAGAAGRSCGDISDQLIAEVPDMTRLLDRLERLEYVSRARSSVDRRMVRVTITDKGRGVLSSLHDQVRECHAKQLGHLGQTKMAELVALLRVVLSKVPGDGKAVKVQELGGQQKHPPH
jgi:DNA-binding MarR family transcriptional regulator